MVASGLAPTPDLGRGQPRYMLLAQRLAEDIAAERYPLDTLLPTEAELSSRYDVSRFTVREALRQLQQLGLVTRRQGVGTKVVAVSPAQHYTHAWNSIEELLQYAVETRLEDIEMTDVVADTALAERLGVPVGQEFLRIRGVRVEVADPEAPPICWTDIFVSAAFAGIRGDIGRHRGLIADLIERRYGEKVAEIGQEIDAARIPKALAEKLKVSAGSPGLEIQRRYIGDDGKPFEISLSTHPAGRFTYSMRLRRNGGV